MDVTTERDIERLRQLAQLQDRELQRTRAELAAACAELAALKGMPATRELQLRLERIEAALGQAQAPAPERGPKAPRKKQRGHGPKAQQKLAVEQRIFELDEADRTCPGCGGRLEEMEGQYETSEMIDVIEVSYRVVQVQQQKYSCRCGCIETAEGPVRTVKGGRYSLDFGVKVGVDKYVHHQPLERQVRMMLSHGLETTSQALWDQVYALASLCRPTWDAYFPLALSGPIIGVDQTGWPRLDDKSQKKWQMWCVTSPRVIAHRICDDKSAATFDELLGDYTGYVVCDDLETHNAGARASPDLMLVGCWAHIHRRFKEALPDFPIAEVPLRLIGELYEIDRTTPEAQLAQARTVQSRRVLAELKAWLLQPPVLTTTNLGKAIVHTLKNWDKLTRLVDDPIVWLDNNPTERALRGPVVGRRNHFGSKSRRGTEAASILYSLAETAKLNGIDPYAYIRKVALNAVRDPGAVTLPWDVEPE